MPAAAVSSTCARCTARWRQPARCTPRLHAHGRDLHHFNAVSCFSGRVVVPQSGAVAIPKDIPLERAALLGCAVVTGVGAVTRTAGVRPGESVAVIGCGGVGLNAVQAANLCGAWPIIAVDVREEALELARALGASHTLDASRVEVGDAVRRITGGGVAWAFEVLGRPQTIEQAWGLIRPGGSVIVVGLPPKGSTVTLPAFDFISEKNIRGCFYGSSSMRRDLPTLVNWLRAGKLQLDPLVTRTRPLEEVEQAFQHLRTGTGLRTILSF